MSLQKAKEFAEISHAGQKRKHGNRPYIYHPECVALYLEEKSYSGNIVAAAWLHDTVEDCPGVTYNILCREFGPDIARLVSEVSHPFLREDYSRSERWKIYLEHYEKASDEGQTLKLADRYCNLKEYLDFWDDVPNRDRKFLNTVYLSESVDLLDNLSLADSDVSNDLLYMINDLDELCSESDL
jgi:(p)ppGpp synthase/HD superfamily hydrolase